MGFSIVFSDSASDSTVSSVVCSVMNPCLSDLEKRRPRAGTISSLAIPDSQSSSDCALAPLS